MTSDTGSPFSWDCCTMVVAFILLLGVVFWFAPEMAVFMAGEVRPEIYRNG
jgi:hypothetical protein